MKIKKIGVLGIRGLPARYGAFDTMIHELITYAYTKRKKLHFYVPCTNEFKQYSYDLPNIDRVFIPRFSGIGIISFGLLSFIKLYFLGVRNFLVMGYTLAPFFKIFEFFGCHFICNVDGIEWRRSKWKVVAKAYFRFCERMVVRSNAILIYDAYGIERYYKIIHARSGNVIFYGSDRFDVNEETIQFGLQPNFGVVVMRMEPENHILEIVKAKLNSTSLIKLKLIGPRTPFFEKFVLPLILGSEKIEWLGPIYDRKKLYKIRKSAYFYVHGHSVGGTNPTLVEACEFKTPIIAYNSIFNKEVLGESAVYFKNEAELCAIFDSDMRHLPQPPKLDEKYTWESVCYDYISLLEKSIYHYGRRDK